MHYQLTAQFSRSPTGPSCQLQEPEEAMPLTRKFIKLIRELIDTYTSLALLNAKPASEPADTAQELDALTVLIKLGLKGPQLTAEFITSRPIRCPRAIHWIASQIKQQLENIARLIT